MAQKLMFINVHGKQHEWSFHFYGDPKHIEEYRADGLEVFIVEDVIPADTKSIFKVIQFKTLSHPEE